MTIIQLRNKTFACFWSWYLAALILLTILFLTGRGEAAEQKSKEGLIIFKTVSEFAKDCPDCGGTGVTLDWDSVKTGLLAETPVEQRRYVRCPYGCPVVFGYKWKGRYFIIEPLDGAYYRIFDITREAI